MATDYAGAVRSGAMQAARLHWQLDSQRSMQRHGGSIDVFGAILRVGLPLLLRPLKGLLGAYLQDPIPGVIVTTERPLSIQRLTAAHELGHFWLKHQLSFDDERILRRMSNSLPDPNLQEVEADAFALGFLLPRWLIVWHCEHQGWLAKDLREPRIAYQLSLRLGASYEATSWTLQRYSIISPAEAHVLRQAQPRQLKAELLQDYHPENYRADVWMLTERDADTHIDGSRNDHFVLRLNEHSGGGYIWNTDQLRESGFAVIRDFRDSTDPDGIGGPVIRHVTAALEEAGRGRMSLDERRPWQPSTPLTQLTLDYDFTGPEEQGLSRAERRQILQAA
ncbi:MAG: protease inhibitor I42 family protein [Alphaproteobacteria bacterium]